MDAQVIGDGRKSCSHFQIQVTKNVLDALASVNRVGRNQCCRLRVGKVTVYVLRTHPTNARLKKKLAESEKRRAAVHSMIARVSGCRPVALSGEVY